LFSTAKDFQFSERPGLPDFSRYNLPKKGILYQITTKCTKCPLKVPNGCKIDRIPKNKPTSSIARPSKIYPKLDFWLENIPSGNLGKAAAAAEGPFLKFLNLWLSLYTISIFVIFNKG
jgi:hypothetical protein